MSKAQQVIEELSTVAFIDDSPKEIKYEDLPEPIRKAVGFLSKNVKNVSSTLGTYNLDTDLTDLNASLIDNLSKLGKHLAKIKPVGDKLVISLKKDWKDYTGE
jgi:hypothetical protein